MDYKEDLWKICKMVAKTGGEIQIIFNKRGKFGRIPSIRFYPENCRVYDEITIMPDD